MKILITILSFFIFFECFAQNAISLKTYDHKTFDGSNLKVYAENGLLTITVLKANLIKISYQLKDKVYDSTTVATSNEFVRVTQNLDDIFLYTDSLSLTINKWDFNIHFEAKGHKLLTNNTQAFIIPNLIKGLSFSLSAEEEIIHKKQKLGFSKGRCYLVGNHNPQYYISSKGYALYFDNKGSNFFNYVKTKPNQFQLNSKRGQLSYYFIYGDCSFLEQF